jgi:hypothetical protein
MDNRRLEFIVSTAVIAGLILLGGIAAAFAHSDGHQLYDADCCNQIDCAPVEKVEVVPTGRMHAGMSLLPTAKLPTTTIITTKHGTVAIPEDFTGKSRRQSRDGRMHACIRQTASGAKLICLYEPPGI